MSEKGNLTKGSIVKVMIRFALPYLLSCFMQTFYGMADLYVVGLFNGAAVTSAVSIGSQVMHMLTVIIVGLAMGTTVRIGRSIGAGKKKEASKVVGTTVVLFSFLAILLMVVLLIFSRGIVHVMMTPPEAVHDTMVYLIFCFLGIPFIVAFNVISSVFRGAGDSKSPMYFVCIACIVNVILDFVLVGVCHMGAAGAALATICGQAVSVVVAWVGMHRFDIGIFVVKEDMRIEKGMLRAILKVGIPISLQDGLIQVAFIVITMIANGRGLVASAAVGIVEKLISFLFLVPSAFLSAISAITAQNMGAGKPERARKSLGIGLVITVIWGVLCCLYNQWFPQTLVGLFSKDAAVVAAGVTYMRAYSFDCIFAAIHFCFSGYFCGAQKSGVSFLHNMVSIVLVRIPGAYLASVYFPDTLYPMGWAAPLGSLLSALICICFFWYYQKRRV